MDRPAELKRFTREKGELQTQVRNAQAKLTELKARRAGQKPHVELQSLPDDQRFEQLRPEKRHLVDTIKAIACRAETGMAGTVREQLARNDDARSLLRKLCATPADLILDPQANTLTVRLHHRAAALQDAAVAHLCAELNATETIFPGTELRLIYELSGRDRFHEVRSSGDSSYGVLVFHILNAAPSIDAPKGLPFSAEAHGWGKTLEAWLSGLRHLT